MTQKHQESLNETTIEAIYKTVSPERMGTYLVSCGQDRHRAAQMYLWNAQIGEAFHVIIQGVEVALRNAINRALIDQYGSHWWIDLNFLSLADHDRRSDLELVTRRIRNRGLMEINGQIVAGLSFGFWVGMLQPRYNMTIWSKHLRVVFPNLPEGRSRKSLARAVGEIAFLRNRISHHEPLLKRDISRDYKLVTEVLEWVCPSKHSWLRPHCRVPEILRQKP